MRQEDKELLLKDLSTRLPYGVKAEIPYNKGYYNAVNVRGVVNRASGTKDIEYTDIVTDRSTYPIKYVKPYLRPMSSMTEEEQKEFVEFHCVKLCPIIMKDCLTIENESNMFDWLNAHHFDYRNLIPKGLAIEVTEENNPYNL